MLDRHTLYQTFFSQSKCLGTLACVIDEIILDVQSPRELRTTDSDSKYGQYVQLPCSSGCIRAQIGGDQKIYYTISGNLIKDALGNR
jgi:hypothetical protein